MKDSEIQRDTVKIRYTYKIEIENLRHKHIMEEIEAMKKAKITKFVRQVTEDKNKD